MQDSNFSLAVKTEAKVLLSSKTIFIYIGPKSWFETIVTRNWTKWMKIISTVTLSHPSVIRISS